jgi:hypothetical protein
MTHSGPLDSRLDGLLEVHLCRAVTDSYEVELRFDDLSSQGQNEPVRGLAAISPEELRQYQNQPQTYGEKLSAGLFQDEGIRSTFSRAKAAVGARNGRLRISLVIEPAAPQLHALAWELLIDPVTKARISTNEGTPFSRFLFGRDWTGIPLLRKTDLKVLIAVPDPSNLEDWGMTKVDVKGEIQRARGALEGVRVRVLEGPVTLTALIDGIAEGIDVLYLVCHGALLSPDKSSSVEDFEGGYGEGAEVAREQGIKLPVLYLERDETRQVGAVSGGRFARRLADLGRRPLPRLVVLASCESAGVEGDWTGQSAQASLAPRLARAGVPALVAMQGKVSVTTAEQFMKPFFSHLVDHGSIDQAVAAARGRVRDRPDYWMPALFLRLKDGRLWYEPSFTPGARVNFDSIGDEIAVGKFTPIVGWGLAERIYGSKAELSERLAAEKLVPLEPHRQGELALVSQYLQLTARSDANALRALKERMRAEVLERFKDRFEGDLNDALLSTVLNAAGKLQRTTETDPYRVVARLPATVFINASPDGLLTEALSEAGKTPLVRTAHWKFSPTSTEAEKLNPTEMNPLVLHVFGHFADPESLVLGEDDYLDYLMGVAQNQALISNVVKDAITNRALMFLGFNLTDWSFRVLFRIIMNLMAGAKNRQSRKPNVAVQVEPDGSLFSGAEEARYYLQKFYGPSNIEPYWGTSEDFLTELWPKVKAGLEKRNAEANAY